MLEYIGQCLHH